MSETRGATLRTDTTHQGRIFTVVRDRVLLPNGRKTTLDVVRHAPSVVLIPMPDPDHIVLLRQYRYAIDRWIWELPAGNRESGEDLVAAAARECAEEIGQVPTMIEQLGSFHPTPGYCDEEMVFFRLTGLTTPHEPAQPDVDEVLTPNVVTLTEARRMVSIGSIVDMKTALGLTLL